MYYPKSQIKTGLYTNGDEYILSTTKEGYIGPYYETSNGTLYTGTNPQTPPNIPLIFIQSDFIELRELSSIENPKNPIIQYIPEDGYFTPTNLNRLIPSTNVTLPTDQDKQNGQFSRYFCKKNNELIYLEIDKITHDKLNNKDKQIAWDLYTPTIVLWQIKGNKEQVFNSNKGTAISIEQNLNWPGFSQYFQDKFLKYYLEL